MAEAAHAHAELLEWPKKDRRRFLHAVYRVGDLDRTIKFYTECFGMKLLRKRDVPEEKYSNAFLGFGPEESHFVVELTYNYGVSSYDIGTGFGHFAIATQDVYKMVEDIKAKGGTVTREPGPVKGGTTVIAFVKDPDGYLFELIQRGPTPEPLCQVMLRVGDLERSIKFYEKALGMKLLRKIDNPDYKYTLAMMGYAVLELTYNYGVTEYTKGNAYAQVAFNCLLHAVYQVGDVERMITECFGMKLLTKMDIPEEKYASAFLGFGPEGSHFVVESTYDYGESSYDIGTGFGHSAIATQDVYKMVTHNLSNMENSEKIDIVMFMIRGTIGTSVQRGWWLDSGATVHGCNDRSLIQNFQEEVDPEFQEVRMADNSIARTEGQGSVELEFTTGKKILLPNVYYVPRLNKNLISVRLLDEMGLRIVFASKMVHLWMNETWVGMGFAKDGMYQLSIN